MAKRLLDVLIAAAVLLALSPVLLVVLASVWAQDYRSPFYIAPRVGRGGRTFRMIKVRSMVVGADRTGVESTSAADPRITALGHFVRRWKIDELPQLWNVLRGDMSLVGPRPNTRDEVARYTPLERHLLDVRPGITDISSIVFSDEGEILREAVDPDARYREIIWPWKSRLGLLYVDHPALGTDLSLLYLTALAIADRPAALRGVQRLLARLGAPDDLRGAAARDQVGMAGLAAS